MAYKITNRQKANAKKLGVTIKPSNVKGKKIDVFKNGQKVASIGAKGYGDYDVFLRTRSKSFADERRRLYKARHQKNRLRRGTPGFYADRILW